MPKTKTNQTRKADEMSVSELNPEDFAPISKEAMGKGVAKLAIKPKPKKKSA